MPEVTLRPINQCTLDDPTDGAEPPSVIASPPRGPDLEPPCQVPMPGAGGAGGNECSDELVRRFSGEGGAPTAETLETGQGTSRSCFAPALQAMSTCSALVFTRDDPSSSAPQKFLQAANCAAAVATLVECLTGDGGVH